MDYTNFLNLIEAAHNGDIRKFDICASKHMDDLVLFDAETIKKIKTALNGGSEFRVVAKTNDGILNENEATNNCTCRKKINANGHEYVDLGLPSGTLWAKCNVGASKESGYGGYYQWGGIEDFADKEKNCYWVVYPYGYDWTKLAKYNTDEELGTVDNKTVLDLSDDVAHQVMGGDWHMPTKEQLQELIDNTTSEWTTVDGINGRRFTSKFNGNSIFIPAAGWRAGRSLNSAGYNCYLWSSSLYQSSPSNAYYLYFSSGICDIYTNRSCGLSVRGVLH